MADALMVLQNLTANMQNITQIIIYLVANAAKNNNNSNPSPVLPPPQVPLNDNNDRSRMLPLPQVLLNDNNNPSPMPLPQQVPLHSSNNNQNNPSPMQPQQQVPSNNNKKQSPMLPEQQVPLNHGHACNNPARTAAGSPFFATGGSFSLLDGSAILESCALKGDWKGSKKLIDSLKEEERNRLLTSIISVRSRTALHVAACAGKWEFVEKLAGRIPKETLGLKDELGWTALHYAALGGDINACKALVRADPQLTQITSNDDWTPLLAAARCALKVKEVVWFLVRNTTDEPPGHPFTGHLAGKLSYTLAAAGFHDILLYLIESYPGLATIRDECGCTLLDALALRPSDFESGINLGSWQKWIYPFIPVELNLQYASPQSAKLALPTSPPTNLDKGAKWTKKLWNIFWEKLQALPLVSGINQVQVEKLKHKYAQELINRVGRELKGLCDDQIYGFFLNSGTMSTAAAYGVVEIVELCLQMIPNVIWLQTNQQPLLYIAVEHRQEKILNLIYKMDVHNRIISMNPIDASNNSILHMAAQLAPPAHLKVVSGAALQMQRELQWFKEIEKLVHPIMKETPNVWGKTAEDLLMEQHKDLLDKGEQWMKDTANSCMVVAALIATIMFAAAFTVPGGNNSDTGIPIFIKDESFLVFAVSDALGLIFSTTSLLTFLSILTARYAIEDFLEHLPGLLIRGLGFLFLAIVAMMIAFAASFFIIVREGSKPVAIAVIVWASIPAVAYAVLQLPLYIQMRRSMYSIFQNS